MPVAASLTLIPAQAPSAACSNQCGNYTLSLFYKFIYTPGLTKIHRLVLFCIKYHATYFNITW